MRTNERSSLPFLFLRAVCFTLLFVLVLGWASLRAKADDAIVTYTIKNDKDNSAPAKGYAVFVDVTPDKIDVTKTKGTILTSVRLEPRPPLGTLIVFENKDNGIPLNMTDDIQIRFKNLPAKKVVRFSDVSTLRSGVGRDARVIQEGVPRVGMKTEADPMYT